MSDATITFVVLGAAVGLFVLNRLPVGIVALGAALALYFGGVVSVDGAFAGFGDPTVVFIASLFVVGEALDSTGVTTWAGQRLTAAAGGRPRRLTVLLLGLVALLSALISVNGAVAALVPMTVVVALRTQRAPSALLMPLAFSAHAGSLLALTGTPVNVLVSQAAADAGVERFGFFAFTLVGVPLVIGTVALAMLLGPRLLPARRARSIGADLSGHAGTLVEQYRLSGAGQTHHEVARSLFTRESGVAELVVPPRSQFVGDPVFPGMTTEDGQLVVLAVRRQGENLDTGPTALREGDTLLVQGTWPALDVRREDPGILVVDDPGAVRRQVVPLGPGAKRALVVVAAMVVLLAGGIVPAAVAGALAAGTLVLVRVLAPEQAYRAVDWTTIILIGGMIPVSAAIQDSGAGDDVARLLVDAVGGAGPYALLAGLFVLTAVFGQFISNTATALIVIPIAVSAAAELDVSARPVLMSVAVASAAAFLTPIATPANLMVAGPAGYRFGDFWRLGLAMLALFFLVGVLLVPAIWSF